MFNISTNFAVRPLVVAIWAVFLAMPMGAKFSEAYGQEASSPPSAGVEEVAQETELASDSIFARAWSGGVVVFVSLLSLVILSVLSWAVVIAKFVHLNKLTKCNDKFIKSFWESRSLNELNGRLSEHPYSPVKEVFRTGYSELVRGSQLREQAGSHELAFHAAVENLGRALNKARTFERKRMEKFLPILATVASAAPFIGLFGTVWGIMGAFEGIAQSGSASLAAVAPGISEALIATAFGLAAAIPAVIGFNMANARIRQISSFVDGFSADFINIVERYLVMDRSKGGQPSSTTL